MNGLDLYVAPYGEGLPGNTSWTAWKLRPGMLGAMAEREVSHPLPELPPPSFGPETNVHAGPRFFAYDFSAPEGTPVLAMEDGDGSVAVYSHLKKDSVPIEPCAPVKAVQVIGASGNTGYSSDSHLHVEVNRPAGAESFATVPLRFKVQRSK